MKITKEGNQNIRAEYLAVGNTFVNIRDRELWIVIIRSGRDTIVAFRFSDGSRTTFKNDEWVCPVEITEIKYKEV